MSGDYLRRNTVKKKKLFYALFLSQILAPVAFIPVVMSYFTQRMSCNFIISLACVSGTISLALLITVILGIKVYKCLNNRKIILVILGIFQALSTTVVIFDVAKTRGYRRLTGSCIRTDDLRFTRYFVIIQFLESLFICGCFTYVCLKSRKSPASRGRISLRLSMDDLPIEFPEETQENAQNAQPARRGWWDYVPEDRPAPSVPAVSAQETQSESSKGFLKKMLPSKGGQRKALLTEKGADSSQAKRSARDQVEIGGGSRVSVAPSVTSKFSRMGMVLFQQVMKDELLYTTFITFNCVVVAVLVNIGVNFKNGLSVTGWIALNWGMVSILAIHSFGRVVHRHERDALLSHPVTCTAITKAATQLAGREERVRKRTISRRTMSSGHPTLRTVRINPDPFADTQALNPHPSMAELMAEYPDIDITSMVASRRASRDQDESTTPRLSDSHFPSTPRDLEFRSHLSTPTPSLNGHQMQEREHAAYPRTMSISGMSTYSLQSRESS